MASGGLRCADPPYKAHRLGGGPPRRDGRLPGSPLSPFRRGVLRMMLTIVCLLGLAEPITPSQLHDALQVPTRGKPSELLAERIRAAFPEGTDFKAGVKPLVDGSMVAFIVEADASPTRPPRVTGMINHGQG